MIQDQHLARQGHVVQFGRRTVPPRACVVDNKPHVRSFLAEALDDLGFIAHGCAVPDLAAALKVMPPDLIVLGPLGAASELAGQLRRLAAFRSKVMLFGGRSSAALVDAQELGERLGLAMLPALRTPFRDADLGRNLEGFLPIAPSPTSGSSPFMGLFRNLPPHLTARRGNGVPSFVTGSRPMPASQRG